MKAILEFKWPEQEKQFETAYLGHAYKEIIDEYLRWFAFEINSEVDLDRKEILLYVRDQMFQLMRDSKLEIK